MAIGESKTERIEVRTTPSVKALLQRVAAASHKNVTDFLLDAGINAAEDALANQQVMRLDEPLFARRAGRGGAVAGPLNYFSDENGWTNGWTTCHLA